MKRAILVSAVFITSVDILAHSMQSGEFKTIFLASGIIIWIMLMFCGLLGYTRVK